MPRNLSRFSGEAKLRPRSAVLTRFGYGPISTFPVLTVQEYGSAPETPIWTRLLCD